ncbi:MAG TPA: class I SAM-dependent rRNA methyltransferase [Bacteroidales bacterium]|nr:class I SAM-dependent rRNA methyltransferase [Bacteroidales bacterium]
MERYPRIVLKPGKETALQRRHPWIFSGAVKNLPARVFDGDVVEVFSASGNYLATGHFQHGGIAVKVFSFTRQPVDLLFWTERLREACDRRKAMGLFDLPGTNVCRLVHSEGDHLPGLIIDWYNGVAVIQAHSAGMHRVRQELAEALQTIFGDRLKAVYDKSRESLRTTLERAEGKSGDNGFSDGFLLGECEAAEIMEGGHRFRVDFVNGQKTGFFLDQRLNRQLVQQYARGRKVLNAFSYTGAFSVYALAGGATMVHSVDSSQEAIRRAAENITLNGYSGDMHRESVADVKQFLPALDEMYDLIILDPPAFAKTHTVTHNALQAYIHINAEAMKKLNPGGLLFTFSCSQAISREMFRSAVQAAAIETGRDAGILHHLSQGPDHPVNIFHPEGEYLKGIVLLA